MTRRSKYRNDTPESHKIKMRPGNSDLYDTTFFPYSKFLTRLGKDSDIGLNVPTTGRRVSIRRLYQYEKDIRNCKELGLCMGLCVCLCIEVFIKIHEPIVLG